LGKEKVYYWLVKGGKIKKNKNPPDKKSGGLKLVPLKAFNAWRIGNVFVLRVAPVSFALFCEDLAGDVRPS
jgi:hypothetical protein|tara:strand:- start:121 stop:333 length:213 start_codon:yes stop_codon:yes gene_type:complete